MVAIAAGVALGYAVSLINASALAEFARAERSLAGTADLSVVGPPAGFDESWYGRIAADPAVVLAAPRLEFDASVAGESLLGGRPPPALHVIGLDALRSLALTPDLVGRPTGRGEAALGALLDGGLFLSPAALAEHQLHVGATVALAVDGRRVALRVAGELPQAHEAVASLDLAYAQWWLGGLGRLTRIDVQLAPGADAAAAPRSWALPPTLRVERVEAAIERQQGISRAYRVNLDVLATVALFTGAFLVYSLQAQAAVVRRPQLALLRMLGLTRGQVAALLLAEALALGVLGVALGLAGGAVLAELALRSLGGDLGGGYFAHLQPRVALDLADALRYAVLGLAAALAGAWLPAREAGAQSPAAGLKAGLDPSPGSQRVRAGRALAGFLVAAALLALPPWKDLPLAAYAAIGVLLVSTIASKPVLAPWLFGPLARSVQGRARRAADAPAWLAAARLARLPRFASVGTAGIVASFALMVSMATMVHSFRASFDDWLDRMLPADLYVRAAASGDTATLTDRDQRLMAADADVERAQFARALRIVLDPAAAPLALLARRIDRTRPEATLPLVGPGAAVPAGAIPVWVSEPVRDRWQATAGTRLRLPLGAAGTEVVVAGVWRDYARQGGSIVMDIDDYARASGDTARTDAALWLRAGAVPAAVAQRLLATLEAPAGQIGEPGQIRAASLRVFDRSFAVTYLLEWAAIAIGLLGLATTFSAQAVARTREFGMLRHLGVTRGQVLGMLGAESFLVTLLAAVLGLVAGLAIAWILVAFVNPQSFHWSMDLRVPAGALAGLGAVLLVAAVTASTLAGRRALSIEAVRAVKDDW